MLDPVERLIEAEDILMKFAKVLLIEEGAEENLRDAVILLTVYTGKYVPIKSIRVSREDILSEITRKFPHVDIEKIKKRLDEGYAENLLTEFVAKKVKPNA